MEIVVVDDGSGEEFVREYRLPANARLFVNESNIGIAAVSRNRGIAAARGEYVAFLDQDDSWKPEKIAVQVEAMEREKNAVMHFTHYERVDESGRALEKQNRFGGVGGDLLKKWIVRRPEDIVCYSSVMLRKAALVRLGFFDENIRMSADWDMWLRCAGHGGVLADARRLVKYREHPGQWSKNAAAGFASQERVLAKAQGCTAKQRPELAGLIRKRRARLLREAARAQLASGERPEEAMTFLEQSAKISRFHPGLLRLKWTARRARRGRKE